MRQIAFHDFERQVHDARKTGELSQDQICAIWLNVQKESLGPAFNFDDVYKYYWAYISHFLHVPFYVYAYAFVDCLVNALYNAYDTGAVLLDVSPAGAKQVYFTREMMNHHASSVLIGEYLYGFSNSILTAMRFADGKVAWQHERPKLPNYTSPIIVKAAGKEQLIFVGCDLVSSFEPLTGKKLWEHLDNDYLSDTIYLRYATSSPAVEKKGDLAGLLTNLQPRDVLFID